MSEVVAIRHESAMPPTAMMDTKSLPFDVRRVIYGGFESP
jgi:uncharacterized protein YbaA (DUF1428 family)